MYFALFNRSSLRLLDAKSDLRLRGSTVFRKCGSSFQKSARDLRLRVLNPPVRMRPNETKPLDPAVRHLLVGGPWRMAMVG